MKKAIFIFFSVIALGVIGYYGFVYYIGSWYAENEAKSRRTTYDQYGGDGSIGRYAQESVNRGVFVKKLNFVVETDSLKRYFNEKDTIFYIEKGYHHKKWSSNDTRILTEKETNYPYQFIACDFDYKNKMFRFHYFKEDNLSIYDSLSGSYYHPKIMLKNIDNDTIFLKIYTRNFKNTEDKRLGFKKEKEAGVVKVFSD